MLLWALTVHFVSLYQSIITQTQAHGGRVDISATTSPAPKVCGGYQRTERKLQQLMWQEEQLYFPDMFWSLGFSKVEEHVVGQWGVSLA